MSRVGVPDHAGLALLLRLFWLSGGEVVADTGSSVAASQLLDDVDGNKKKLEEICDKTATNLLNLATEW